MPNHTFDAEIIRQLANVLNETNLNEIKYAINDVKIELVRHNVQSVASVAAPVPVQTAVISDPVVVVVEDFHNHPGAIKSPMVGNVYLASEPGAKPFVQENEHVTEGQVLLILEAMKVMNPLRAPKSGTVKKIFAKNSVPVEYDEVLMIIE